MSLLSRIAVEAARAYGMFAKKGGISASVLIVAGGASGGAGSGGYGPGGGGGAGEYYTSSSIPLIATTTYSIVVGAGGAGVAGPGGTSAGSDGNNGSNSSFSTYTVKGGGFGAGGHTSPNGGSGGSGGGAGGSSAANGIGGSASPFIGQGFAGGSATVAYDSKGGGGAGATTTTTTGGVGLSNSISGSAVYYSGGGGGAVNSGAGGAGGNGGGGAGGTGSGSGTAGTANTGGGGGGGGNSGTGAASGAGGSGIVIISYASATPLFVGGTITTSGGNQIHTFTSSGTLSPITPITASYLVVAGGGGGAAYIGGGGGAGGYQASSTTLYSGATYVVTVGAGGTAGINTSTAPGAGNNSVVSGTGLTTITSTGGGYGGYYNGSAWVAGGNGGSGGGGGIGSMAGGTGTSGQGNNGGAGSSNSGTTSAAGGGGGATAAGSAGATSTPGNGGNGTASSISGSSVTYAGGGGGAAHSSFTATSTGGTGGGGNGGSSSIAGSSGTPNLGGGGGGGGVGYNGGAGGSGIVIISYAGSQVFNGGLVTTSGGNTIHTFTSTGALTPLTNNLNNSLRFRSSASAYLNRTPSVAGSRTTWTWSAWVKKAINGTANQKELFGVYSNATNFSHIYFDTDDTLIFTDYVSSSLVSARITSSVYRDPSAWYHIVVVYDTTQATANNRIRMYVNGNQITAFSTTTNPSQNYASGFINSAAAHTIGVQNSAYYFDGYMTDINFIDGQALEPYYFGNNDANGVWKPIQYKGTYGTNGFYLPFTQNATSSYAGSFTYASSQVLSVADNAALELGSSDFCVEGWYYPTSFSNNLVLLGKRANTSATGAFVIYANSGSGLLTFYASTNGSSYFLSGTNIGTINLNQWNHFAVYRKGNDWYGAVNGVVSYMGSSSNSIYNNTDSWRIGGDSNGNYATGYISNTRIVTGNSVYTSSNFTPPSSALTAITGTQLLTLQNSTIIDNSTNAFSITNTGSVTTSTQYPFSANTTVDASGNYNYWNPVNIQLGTPSATTYDSMTDVPTNTSATVANYAVMNPLNATTSSNLNYANLQYSNTNAGWGSSSSTIAMSSGKWYWEITVGTLSSNNLLIGIESVNTNWIGQTTNGVGATSTGYSYFGANGQKYTGGTGSAYGATFTTGDIIGVAFDADAGTLTFYKNGTSQGTAFTGITGTYCAAFSLNSTSTNSNINFGQRPFAYTPPTGYVALNTYNLPTPTILQGNKYMDATTYSGTGSAQSITNAGGFKPDFVWMKQRNAAVSNVLMNSVTGTSVYLKSDTTGAEITDSTILTSFNSNGFTLGTSVGVNSNTGTYVGWQWQAGQGSTSSNTSGTITTTTCVNTTAGFSIFTFTGTGASSASIGHGLGVAPKLMIFKQRNGTNNWNVLTNATGSNQYGFLNLTTAFAAAGETWTSTVINIGANFTNGSTYVCYAWAEIAGFSRFGSFVGNSSTNGPFVYCGFRPRYILFKNTVDYNWHIFDAARNTYNLTNSSLKADTTAAEYTNDDVSIDLLSNGFKLRGTDLAINGPSNTIIFAAFAEHPFKNANAR